MSDVTSQGPAGGDHVASDATPRAGRGEAAALVVAPVVFVVGWAVAGASIDGFSPVRLAISELAAFTSPRRWPMFAVLLGYGAAMVIGSAALRRSTLRSTGVAALVHGVATMVVATTPVHRSSMVDAIHGVGAVVAYATLAAMALLAVRPLRRAGRPAAAVASLVMGAAVAVALALANGNDRTGLFQRIGTTLGNLWTVAAGLALLAGALSTGGRASGPSEGRESATTS